MKSMIRNLQKLHGKAWKAFYSRRTGFWNGESLTPFSSMEESNRILSEAIHSGRPLMVARHGSTELSFIHHSSTAMFRQLCAWSGFFPEDPSLGKAFRTEYLDASRLIDALAVWNYRHGKGFPVEQAIFRDCCPRASLIDLSALSPFLFESPWSSALSGKKVLVIHPFRHSIEAQFAKRHLLFENSNVLPPFSLSCIQAVQSLGGTCQNHASWFEALDWMKQQMNETDFDVALISCGAYGLPLAAHAKRLGRQGIHVGGGLQLLFGIKGTRWEHPSYGYDQRFYNEHWIRPSEEETPAAAASVENACYW